MRSEIRSQSWVKKPDEIEVEKKPWEELSIIGLRGGLIPYQKANVQEIFKLLFEKPFSLELSDIEKKNINEILKEFIPLTNKGSDGVQIQLFTDPYMDTSTWSQTEVAHYNEMKTTGCYFFTRKIRTSYGSYETKIFGFTEEFLDRERNKTDVEKKSFLLHVTEMMKYTIEKEKKS